MHQVPLSYAVVFCQASLELGPSGTELSALPTGLPRPKIYLGKKKLQIVNYCSNLIGYYLTFPAALKIDYLRDFTYKSGIYQVILKTKLMNVLTEFFLG